MNGNRQDFSPGNLAVVSLDDAMNHIDEWNVDWDIDLTPGEVDEIQSNPFYPHPVYPQILRQFSQRSEPDVRPAYMAWCATYGKVPCEARFANFNVAYEIYLHAKFARFETPDFSEISMYADLSCAENDVMIDRYGTETWKSQLDKDASDAYHLWCTFKHGKEGNEVAFQLNYMWELINSAMAGEPYECISFYLYNDCMEMTEVELAEMRGVE